MLSITHNALFVIFYRLETSFDLEYKSSFGQLYKTMNVNRN